MANESMVEVEPITIAALNQYVFCPRRCALMFVEGIWADNEHTALGTLLHDRTDLPGYETDEGVTLLRALPLFSERYGLSGKADIVEVRSAPTSRRVVDFKEPGLDQTKQPTCPCLPKSTRQSNTRKAGGASGTTTTCSFVLRRFAWRRCSP